MKRRNQSGRTVISADPTLRMDELAVPPEIAANLTVPDTVYSLNRDFLQKLVDDGKANFVLRGENRINLKYATTKRGTQILWGDIVLRGTKEINPTEKNFELKQGDRIRRDSGEIVAVELNRKKPFKIEIGDIVERQLRDNDYVLFNRQPSLHRGSLLAKKVIIREGRTFRFALSSCKSYNAKFGINRRP